MLSLKNKNIAVTGGAGFIGSHLVDKLVKESPNKIVVIDDFSLGKERNLEQSREKITVEKVDVTQYDIMHEIFKKNQIEVVFDLAVIPLPASLVHPEEVFNKNIRMTEVICALQRKDAFKTLIHFSSSEVYGSAKYMPMDEKHEMDAKTPYASSKGAGDLLIMSYLYTFGLDVAIIRPFNNFGPRQNEGSYAGLIPLTLQRIFQNESPIIYGNGEQTRDYLYVTDTVQATVEVFKQPSTRGKVINIARGEEISVTQVIQMLMKATNCTLSIKYEKERPGDVVKHIADISLARKLIGFKPKTGMEEGILKTVEWYKLNLKNTNRLG